MIRDKFTRLGKPFNTIPRAVWAVFGIVVGMTLLTLGGLINLLSIDAIVKYILFTLASLGVLGGGMKLLSGWNAATLPDNTPSLDDETSPAQPAIPPMPSDPPKVSIQDLPLSDAPVDDPSFIVLKKISDRLEADALAKRQENEKERQSAEAKARLLADDTVYYDKRPKIVYYFRRGLWKTLLAWLVGSGILALVLSMNHSPDSQPPVLLILLLIAVILWYTIRCYGDWAWTKRRIKGNLAMVQEASNGWFGLFGKLYKISLLDCGNVVIAKQWYERALRLSSGTVSIETVLDNKKAGDSNDKVYDVFKDMRNMCDPETFQDIVLKRHDELMFGQPDVIRRNDQ